jgi:hypothetical protein
MREKNHPNCMSPDSYRGTYSVPSFPKGIHSEKKRGECVTHGTHFCDVIFKELPALAGLFTHCDNGLLSRVYFAYIIPFTKLPSFFSALSISGAHCIP